MGKKLARIFWGVLAGLSALPLSGCIKFGAYLNLPVEGPRGEWAVVLSRDGEHDSLPRGGYLWVFRETGELLRDPLFLGDDLEGVRVCDWGEDGTLLLLMAPKPSETAEITNPQPVCYLIEITNNFSTIVYSSFNMIYYAAFYGKNYILFVEIDPVSLNSHLMMLNRLSRDIELCINGVIGFAPFFNGVILLYSDGSFGTLDGRQLSLRISNWDEEMKIWYLIFFSDYFAVSPTGRYVAIRAYELPAIVLSEERSETTGLYLVDLQSLTYKRLATDASSPCFSPDGTRLAFIARDLVKTEREVFFFCLDTQSIVRVRKTEGADMVRWGKRGLLVAIDGVLYHIPTRGIFWADEAEPIKLPLLKR